MDEEKLKCKRKFAGEKVPSMHRRKRNFDYSGRSMYMVTMAVEGRRPLFGKVVGNANAKYGSTDAPHIDLTPLGEAVSRCWYEIEEHNPEISIVALQMMPDHFHGILFVREKMEKHLGMALRGFKLGCNKAFRRICPVLAEKAVAVQQAAILLRRTEQDRRHGLLFEPGYNDQILLRRGQLDAWLRYLEDNPRRLLVKREHPEFFRVQRCVEWKGMKFSAIGNLFLLRKPMKVQVQCSRRLTDDEIESKKAAMLAACMKGAVLVSPSISKGEKAIMRAAFEKDYPEIVLKDNGFEPLAKPSGQSFDACAKGQLLLLGPVKHENERKAITRGQCLSLNDIAERICE